MAKAVVLLSGGLDSATCLALAKEQGFEPIAVSFSYGQRHAVELESAQKLVAHYNVEKHYLFKVGVFTQLGGSALTADVPVRKSNTVADIGDEAPATYVPARNTLFLAHALSVAEREKALDIFIGVNALDHHGYPDCRPAFIVAFEALANVATAATTTGGQHMRLHAPLMEMDKASIVQEGSRLSLPFHLTHSCYHPNDEGLACGRCDACLLRLEGFALQGLKDPVPYSHVT